MSDGTNAQNATSSLIMRAQYIRDLSFENPNPIAAFTMSENEQPSISVNIQAKAQDLGERNFEVVLDIRIDAKQEKEPMFIAELSYAGIVTIGGHIGDSDMPHLIMVETPHLLFPFARNILADLTRDSGYPPLLLSPVDFQSLYEQQQTNEQDAQPTQH